MVFPVATHRCESWTIEKTKRQRIDAFELWCWRRLLRVPWTARRSDQSILKEINPEYSWRDWCWSWSFNTLATWYEEPTHWKRPWCWERLKAGREGDDKDEMVGWHHRLNAHKLEQTPEDSEGQGSLACCSPLSHRVGHNLANEQQWVWSFRRDSSDTSLFPYQVHLPIGTTSQNAMSPVSSWAQRNESHLLSDINDQGHIKFSSEYWWIATLWQWLSFMLFALSLFLLFSLFC